MGGDHKCPVCQATFTRPQHVARHMRSHTGDRPYKCQYCGDQFARSDLLSRHVNKCHANEKPLVNTTTRRKGSASTSRATTSKQACDQCVQSSLPCDGSNPCAKCVQRKYRCTYVKFHRQTAPVGPGHNPRPAGALPPAPNVQVPSLLGPSGSSPTTTTSRYPLYADEYGGVLGGQPAGLGDELSQSSSSYGGGRQALHEALYPSQNGGGSSAAANTNYPFAPLYPTNGSAEGAAGDYAHAHSKYGSSRGLPAHDDMYRTSATTLAPTAAHATSGSSAAPTQWAGWPQQGAGGSQHHHQDAYHQQGQGHHAQHTHTLDRNVYGAAGQPAHTLPPPQHQQHDDLTGLYARGQSAGADFREMFAEDFAPHQRRGSVSDGGSGYGDSGSESGYYSERGRKERYQDELGSIDQASPFSYDPHSSSSRHHHGASSVYSDSGSERPGSSSMRPPGTASSTSSKASTSSSGPPHSATTGTFFNAFDSLSLDDASVLAGLAAAAAAAGGNPNAGIAPGGSPFFNAHAPMNLQAGGAGTDTDATPMPIKEEGGEGAGMNLNLGGGAGGRYAEGARIQRPLSSLAALQPSSAGMNLNWNSYLGLGTPGASMGMSGGGGGYGAGGWTPGGVGGGAAAGYAASLAGLGEAGMSGMSGMTPGKEMDPKELREFWKQYLRTPLTTAQGGEGEEKVLGGEGGGVGGASNGGEGGQPGTPFRVRPRVASMPSSGRTPLAVPGGGGAYYQPQPRAGLGPTSSMRTTLNGGGGGKVSKEDLASYEAAVLARKTPINLNMGRLSSRRRGTGGNASGGGGEGHGLARASSSGENLTTQEFGMEGSALSGALGMSQQQQHQHQHQQQQQQKQAAARQFILHNNPGEVGSDESGASASASPASSGGGGSAYPSPRGYGASDVEMEGTGGSRPTSSAGVKMQRPTAKRLASSVLESGNAKAMKYDEAGGTGSGIALPQLHTIQPPALSGMASLPPLSTQNLGNAMRAPPPPSSAPPMSGASAVGLGTLRLPQASGLAERRKMVPPSMSGGLGRERRVSDAH